MKLLSYAFIAASLSIAPAIFANAITDKAQELSRQLDSAAKSIRDLYDTQLNAIAEESAKLFKTLQAQQDAINQQRVTLKEKRADVDKGLQDATNPSIPMGTNLRESLTKTLKSLQSSFDIMEKKLIDKFDKDISSILAKEKDLAGNIKTKSATIRKKISTTKKTVYSPTKGLTLPERFEKLSSLVKKLT